MRKMIEGFAERFSIFAMYLATLIVTAGCGVILQDILGINTEFAILQQHNMASVLYWIFIVTMLVVGTEITYLGLKSVFKDE